MNMILQFTDGTVFDHVAEFMYFPKEHLQQLYTQDNIGYFDAINKIIQIITTSDRLIFPRLIQKEETERLKEELSTDGKVDESTSDFAPDLDSENRQYAMIWVKENWNSIDEALCTDSLVLEAMRGFVKREFTQCFLLPHEKRLSMSHYVSSDEKLNLSSLIINSLLVDVQTIPNFSMAEMKREDVIDWLNRMVTTHYITYAEYVDSFAHHYTPALTRSHLPIQPLPKGEEFQSITRCIAIDILDKVKNRPELVKRSVNWSKTSKGEMVINGFRKLTEAYNISPSSEKKKILEYVNGILDAQKGYKIDLLMGSLSVVKDVSILKDPKGSQAMKLPARLLWLYKMRRKDVTYTLKNRIDKLVEK